METKANILYIDDEKENLEGFYYSFFDDYNIFTTTQPSEAFDILNKKSIEIVIADQKMPEVSGVEFIQQAKKLYPECIYIIVTAHANLSDALRAVNEANIYRFISKPWNDQYLINTINEAVDIYRMRKKNKQLLIELQQQNLELEDAYARIQTSDHLKSQFLKNISHEIRTPLNGIMGFSEIMNNLTKENDQLHEISQHIFKSGEQLLTIFEDIITISLIQAKSLVIKNESFNPYQLISNTIEKYKDRVDENVKIEIIQNAKLKIQIVSDKEKIQKILDILFNNALKFTSKGSITINEQLLKTDNSYHLKYTITDTGIGIDERYQNEIFEPFTQLDNNFPLNSGNGIGLAIAKAFVELLGGSISYSSKVNVGSTFTVLIPVAKEKPNLLTDLF